jgi:hypothetical protein
VGINGMPSFLRGLEGRLVAVSWVVLLVTPPFDSICTIRGVLVSVSLISKALDVKRLAR